MKKMYRPAGNSIVVKKAAVEADLFYPFKYRLFQSGTASLAAALTSCIKLKNTGPRKPEIIVPAYACPDLVSAVLYAGAKPVLVDLEEDSPFLSCEHVANNITADTIAVIAVNFMGLAENIQQLRNICQSSSLLLIYDCAQWFPLEKRNVWPGDFNIISFGRGKPVNLLHGGAVILGNAVAEESLACLPATKGSSFYNLSQLLKIRVYNFVIQPLIYRFVSQLPGLTIGQTLYKPLDQITAMDSFYAELIKHNVDGFRLKTNAAQYLHRRVTKISHPLLINLVARELGNRPGYLLRYPILIKEEKARDQFYEETRNLGTSLLYQRPLNKIIGLENILDQETVYPQANNFAKHLVTLPCHEDIDNTVVDIIVGKLQSVLANGT